MSGFTMDDAAFLAASSPVPKEPAKGSPGKGIVLGLCLALPLWALVGVVVALV